MDGVVSENYEAAYQSLVEVYDNPYRLVLAQFDVLLAAESQKSETFEGLRILIDTMNRARRTLMVMKCPVQHWDNFLVHFLLRRMSPRTISAWETSQDLREMPTLDEVMRFLERRSRGLVNLHRTNTTNITSANTGAIPKQYPKQSQSNNQNDRAKNNIQRANNQNGNKEVSCHNCKQPHPLYRCSQFLMMTIEQRKQRLREINACFNCFKPGHRAGSQECSYDICRRCKRGKHNSLLCTEEVTSGTQVNMMQQQMPQQTQPQATQQPMQMMGHPYAMRHSSQPLNSNAVAWEPSSASALIPVRNTNQSSVNQNF